MKFNEPLRDYVPPQQLWKVHGGDLDFEYEHEKYWPALNAECDKRRAAYKQRWIDGGKQIGEYEEYLRGGSHKSIKPSSAEVEQDTTGGAASADQVPDVEKLKI